MKTITVEFDDQKIIFEQDGTIVSVKGSTLFNHPSIHMNQDKARLVHAIIAQHINSGIDVTSPDYIRGLDLGIIWYCFQESR